MDFYFLNATDAAADLNLRQSQRQWTPSQVIREAKAGRLPVCFDFAGELIAHSVDGRSSPAGESPKVFDFDGVVRSLMPPTTDGVCGFAVPVEIQEAHTIKFSHKDGKLTRGINLPTELPYGGRIKPGHNVECWLEDADVPPSAFLFRNDDLEKLVPATQDAPARPAPETPPSVPVEPVPVAQVTGKVWTKERKAEAQAYRDKHGLKKTAQHYTVSQATISKHTTPKKKPTASLFTWPGGCPT